MRGKTTKSDPGRVERRQDPQSRGVEDLQTCADEKKASAVSPVMAERLHCPNPACQSAAIKRLNGKPPKDVGVVFPASTSLVNNYKGVDPGAWYQCMRCGVYFAVEAALRECLPQIKVVIEPLPGIVCPGRSCRSTKNRVVKSRQRRGRIWRQRECRACGLRWQTEETINPNDKHFEE